MQKLYVLYDSNCELCCRLKDWLREQHSWIALEMIPAGSQPARKIFPELEQIASQNDLAVISDEGAVYLNDRAWIMSLSRWLSSTSPEAIAAELRNIVLEPCTLPEGSMSPPDIRDYLQ